MRCACCSDVPNARIAPLTISARNASTTTAAIVRNTTIRSTHGPTRRRRVDCPGEAPGAGGALTRDAVRLARPFIGLLLHHGFDAPRAIDGARRQRNGRTAVGRTA